MVVKNNSRRGYWSTSQLRWNCRFLASRKESIKDTANTAMWEIKIRGLRNLSSPAGGVEGSEKYGFFSFGCVFVSESGILYQHYSFSTQVLTTLTLTTP
jgi:hypothetical protein